MRVNKIRVPGTCTWCVNQTSKSLCDSCLLKNKERMRKRHDSRRNVGLCQYCGIYKARKNLVYCKSCTEYYKKTNNELEQAKIAKGICRSCVLPAVEGKKLCQPHLDKYNIINKTRRIELLKNNDYAITKNRNACAGAFQSFPCQYHRLCDVYSDQMRNNIKTFSYKTIEKWRPWTPSVEAK